MTFYKEKIQKQLKKTLQHFKNTQSRSNKAKLIKKQGKVKRVFKPRDSFQQKTIVSQTQEELPILNFFNILSINPESIRNPNHNISYLQNNFFDKTIKKIEVKENYIVLFLKDSGLSLTSVEQTISKYKRNECPELQSIGWMLQNLSKKIDLAAIDQESQLSLTNQTFQLLDQIGSKPFICKIFSQKIIISKALLQLQDYNSQQFIIESLKYKFPLFQCISCQNYSKIIQTEIQFYSILLDMLNGNVPFGYFFENTCASFVDTITSKNNIEYQCKMSLSMPIPLVELMKVEEIIDINERLTEQKSDQNFKKYRHKIWQKQNKTLQHLVTLPKNYLPENKEQTATYKDIQMKHQQNIKMQEDDRKSLTFSSKNHNTNSYLKQSEEISLE